MKKYHKNDLAYVIRKENHDEKSLMEFISQHLEIKFVSLIGVDIFGNETDEKIPIKCFIDDIDKFIKGSIQTDGSSVVLPGIASLNNAKVDMIADLDVNWLIDYNFENIDPDTGKPVGTIRIPCYLIHEDVPVDSRHILLRAEKYLKSTLLELFKKYPKSLERIGIKLNDIDDIITTIGTELEFWVKTPDNKADIEELSTSQVLQEQYWNRTVGSIRTSLEESLMMLDHYGLEPEMGHKEVGGVRAKLDQQGNLTSIMEQLEIDWKYDEALQSADNESWVRATVKEVFRNNGLEVTFLAKPIDGVAGSGEHTHLGVTLKLKNGKKVNLFAGSKGQFMSVFGYGSLMGILKNYEVINPMISNTNDSLRRLKPGFEAPIAIVTSLGHSVDTPSRNRTVLLGLVRDNENPLSTRYEIRSPNPHTNTYIAVSGLIMSMIDGIKFAIENSKTEDELLSELSKKHGDQSQYLEKDREYRSEEDIFEDFSDEERSKYFGKSPATLYENLSAFKKYPEKVNILFSGDVFNEKLLNSFIKAVISRWITEIDRRIIPNYIDEIRSFKMLHPSEKALDLDVSLWMAISNLRQYLMKDTHANKSLITRVKDAIKMNDHEVISNLQIELDEKMNELREIYYSYKRNIIDFN
jgi:glutamine synthetase